MCEIYCKVLNILFLDFLFAVCIVVVHLAGVLFRRCTQSVSGMPSLFQVNIDFFRLLYLDNSITFFKAEEQAAYNSIVFLTKLFVMYNERTTQ